jgi:hypothetical protein
MRVPMHPVCPCLHPSHLCIEERNQDLSKTSKPLSKSLDYPLYEKMKKKSPRAAKYWMRGDRLYHAGLFLTMLCLPAVFYVYTQMGSGGMFIWVVGVLLVSIGIFAAGIYLKRESYKLAIKAGIDVNQILNEKT